MQLLSDSVGIQLKNSFNLYLMALKQLFNLCKIGRVFS